MRLKKIPYLSLQRYHGTPYEITGAPTCFLIRARFALDLTLRVWHLKLHLYCGWTQVAYYRVCLLPFVWLVGVPNQSVSILGHNLRWLVKVHWLVVACQGDICCAGLRIQIERAFSDRADCWVRIRRIKKRAKENPRRKRNPRKESNIGTLREKT